LTKCWRRQNIVVEKISVSTKSWRRRRMIPLLFGLAESTATDFSQTSLKISYVSLMVLIPLHAVAKCGVASGHPAFLGGLSPVLYRLIVPACHAENSKILAQQNIGVRLKFTDFRQTIAVYISAHRRPIKKW